MLCGRSSGQPRGQSSTSTGKATPEGSHLVWQRRHICRKSLWGLFQTQIWMWERPEMSRCPSHLVLSLKKSKALEVPNTVVTIVLISQSRCPSKASTMAWRWGEDAYGPVSTSRRCGFSPLEVKSPSCVRHAMPNEATISLLYIDYLICSMLHYNILYC